MYLWNFKYVCVCVCDVNLINLGCLPRLLGFFRADFLSFILSLFRGCSINMAVAFYLLSHFYNIKHFIFLHDLQRSRWKKKKINK